MQVLISEPQSIRLEVTSAEQMWPINLVACRARVGMTSSTIDREEPVARLAMVKSLSVNKGENENEYTSSSGSLPAPVQTGGSTRAGA